MMNDVTTVARGGFRVEDVTFKGARQQSEILKEGVSDVEVNPEKVEVPKSLTPEQVKKYLLKSIQSSNSEDEKRVFAQIVKWIDELSEAKKKLVSVELEEMKKKDSEQTPDDIQKEVSDGDNK